MIMKAQLFEGNHSSPQFCFTKTLQYQEFFSFIAESIVCSEGSRDMSSEKNTSMLKSNNNLKTK